MSQLSRRHFLRGASGAALALPFLPSLARGQAAPTNGQSIIFVMGGNGWRSQPLLPPAALRAAAPTVAPGVKGLRLIDVPGDLSPLLKKLSTPSLKPRLSLISGTNLMVPSVGDHNGHAALAATWAPMQESIDIVAARNLYGTTRPRFELVKLGLGYYPPGSSTAVGTPPSTLNTTNLNVAFSQLFGGAMADPIATRRQALKLKLVDDVKVDYDRVKTLVSTADRAQLEAHLQSLSELQGLLGRQAPPSCTSPTVTYPPAGASDDPPAPEHFHTASQLVVAALRCQASSVFMIDGFYVSNDYHGVSHATSNSGGNIDQFLMYKQSQIDIVADLATQLESAGVNPVTNRPYLDDTLIVHLNECGDMSPPNAADPYDSVYFTHVHTSTNMQVLTLGNLGGKLKTGYHLDYSKAATTPFNGHKVGVPYNQVLVTLAAALGIDAAKYESGAAGFGDYRGLDSNNITPVNHGVETDAQRRAPLPFFFA